jgi:hypothetical protein
MNRIAALWPGYEAKLGGYRDYTSIPPGSKYAARWGKSIQSLVGAEIWASRKLTLERGIGTIRLEDGSSSIWSYSMLRIANIIIT